MVIQSIILIHTKFFPESVCNKEMFVRTYAQVCSRCFGWGIPHTSMIPMADNLNHSDRCISNEVVNIDLHPNIDEKSSYFTKDKFMNDYTTIMDPIKNNLLEEKQIYNIRGRFNRQKFEEHVNTMTLEKVKEKIE